MLYEHAGSGAAAMELGRELKRKLRGAALPVIYLVITAYFVWNAVQGNRGLVAYAQREDVLRRVAADRTAAMSERDAWERRVAGLRTSRLDTDTLDERSRAMLNLARPNDVVVPFAGKEKLF